MIVSAELRNFRSHRATKLEFPNGIISLVGLNGSGKTSLFLAIGKCLFFHNPLTLHDLVMEGESTAQIRIEFISMIDGGLCSVFNQFNSGKDARSIFKAMHENGEVREGSEDVQQFIKHHLQISDSAKLPTVWSDSVGVEQSKFISPFETELTKRRKIFDDLLGVTDYQRAYSNLSSVESELVTHIRLLEVELKSMPEKSELDSANSAVQQKLDTAKKIKKELAEAEVELEQLNFVVEEYEHSLADQAKRKEIEFKIESLKSILDVRDAIAKLVPLTEKQRQLENDIMDRTLFLRSLSANTGAKVQMLTERMTHLGSSEDCKCNLCGSILTPELREVRIKEAKTEIEQLKQEKAKTVESVRGKLAELQLELDNLNDPTTELRILQSKDNSAYADVERELQHLEQELAELPIVVPIQNGTKKRRDDLLGIVGALNNELASLRSAWGLAKRDAKIIGKRLEEANSKRAELLELETKLASLHHLRTGIRAVGPMVADNMISIISQKAQVYLSQMLPYSGMHIRWSSDYVIECKVDGVDRKFEKLSGGEKMVFALAIRLGLIDHISGLGLAFLDEPTTHLDADNRDYLAKCIQRIRGFKQLFVITHDDTFEAVCDKVITLRKDYNETTIEELEGELLT